MKPFRATPEENAKPAPRNFINCPDIPISMVKMVHKESTTNAAMVQIKIRNPLRKKSQLIRDLLLGCSDSRSVSLNVGLSVPQKGHFLKLS